LLVDGDGRPLRPDAVAPLDLVHVGDRLAREHARVRGERLDLVGQPAVLQVGEERVGVVGEPGRLDRLLGADALGEGGRAVVGVDEAVDVPAEAQAELEVALGDRRRLRHRMSGSAPSRRATAARPRSPMSSVRSLTYIATNSSAVAASMPRPKPRAYCIAWSRLARPASIASRRTR